MDSQESYSGAVSRLTAGKASGQITALLAAGGLAATGAPVADAPGVGAGLPDVQAANTQLAVASAERVKRVIGWFLGFLVPPRSSGDHGVAH